ncbi:hypothetical protein [Maridesulfovibrio salexigens]|uniref:Uncharacterized protein n=1 Tax=Maridesulfovibrio salexigens (strain ATCC 14822 / DSM 2638 / NCIMB 8403 / VKM B-1763) TaxID=526222 RepID=C6BT17_MARSD|nr:hypothetical protein [Maridesulfovibrio salexigens]ACS79721.1 hypothetical protein Desal_1659 [Maridesulfovibrio salexigens DSM 2638]
MSHFVYFPRAKFSVSFQYTSRRSFSKIDQIVLQLLNQGQALSIIPELIGLPRRIVVESAFDLLKERMLLMNASSLEITPKGSSWMDKLAQYNKEPIQQGCAEIFYDWNNGSADVYLRLEKGKQEEIKNDDFYDLFKPLMDKDEKKQGKVLYQNKFYDMDKWKDKALVLQYNFDEVKGQVEVVLRAALKARLHREELKLFDMEPLGSGYNGYYRYAYRLAKDVSQAFKVSNRNIPDVSFSKNDWLMSAGDHCRWLKHALRKAETSLLIFSAHCSKKALDLICNDCSGDLKYAYMVLGFNKNFIRFDYANGPRFIADDGSNSDMKVVIYDDADGCVHVALGSFNWLREYRSSNELDDGVDISVLLNSRQHSATIVSIIEAVCSQVDGYSDNVKKSELLSVLNRLRKEISNKEEIFDSTDNMFVFGSTITNECGHALRNAKDRCLVFSHTLHEKLKPFNVLGYREYPLSSFGLVSFASMYSKDCSFDDIQKASGEYADEYIASQKKKLSKCGPHDVASIERIDNMHARLIVADDVVTITFLNCLSSFDVKNAFGLRFKDPESAKMFEALGRELKRDVPADDANDSRNVERGENNILDTLTPEQKEIFMNMDHEQLEIMLSKLR